MLYKTITLNLLQEHQALYERLRQARTLAPTLDRLAADLRDRHLQIRTQLGATADANDPMIDSQAQELALAELQERLAAGWIDSEA